MRNKQHEQQFNKTSGTTKYVLNIVDFDDEDLIKEYDFDINLLDFEWSKSIADEYGNLQIKLKALNESPLSDEIVSSISDGMSLSDLTNITFNESLEDELNALNRILNNYELDTFRLHTKIESLYLHWSTYLSALFLNKNKNINKLKDDLKLLISQINILKEKLKKPKLISLIYNNYFLIKYPVITVNTVIFQSLNFW